MHSEAGGQRERKMSDPSGDKNARSSRFYGTAFSCRVKDKGNTNWLGLLAGSGAGGIQAVPSLWAVLSFKELWWQINSPSMVTDQKHLSADKRMKYGCNFLLRDFAGRLRTQG